MNIGRNILYFRQQQGLTQQQLADALGINKMAISNYEKGKRQPNIETVKAICKALDISLMQFMAYSEGVELSAGHFQNADLLTTAQKESIESQIRYAAQRYYDACLHFPDSSVGCPDQFRWRRRDLFFQLQCLCCR